MLAVGCGAVGRVTSGDAVEGKALFKAKCGTCHTLKDAGTTSTVGPNLDDAFAADKGKPFASSHTEQTVRDIVRGQIAYAEKPMPTDLVVGKQADDVSVYIAKCASETSCDVAGS